MAVFVVVPDNPSAIPFIERISEVIPPGKAFRLPAGQWMISFEGTSRELSEKLGFNDENPSTVGVVFGINSYWGRASGDVWEWLSQKMA